MAGPGRATERPESGAASSELGVSPSLPGVLLHRPGPRPLLAPCFSCLSDESRAMIPNLCLFLSVLAAAFPAVLSSAFRYGDKLPSRRLLNATRPPVVLVPGDLGNQLEAKLNKPSVVHYLCAKKTEDYFTLWLNLELLLPYAIDCWIDNMRLVYNTTTKKTETPPGVDVRIPGFGKTYPLEFLDPSKRTVGIYFYTLVKYMVDWGYLRDEKVRGAPYDWRRAPNENVQFFKDLQAMIESMYKQYGSPVVLIAHSMGNLYTLYFLNHQPQEWKDKYIKSYIALGAPWGGVSKTLRVLATGDNDRIPVISPLKIREQQRTAVSTNWLLPYNNTWSVDKDTEALVYNLTAPGVTIYCLYGTGIPTPESFNYDVFPDQDPKVVNGEGDGTVNLVSALKCKEWMGKQEGKVYMKELPGNEHVDMLSNLSTISYIKRVLFNLPPL
ncbi:lysosomal phospholipase A and acyltransferase isoform X2 [Mobula birostris]|uniref:lysosomal phospholipase A and acyltransferase isoform X2 n=1 Tax=Mobula birostris TaxID=1983395 RepID=UPI003B280F26